MIHILLLKNLCCLENYCLNDIVYIYGNTSIIYKNHCFELLFGMRCGPATHLALLSLKYWLWFKKAKIHYRDSSLFWILRTVLKKSLNLAEFFCQASLCIYTTSWATEAQPLLYKCKNYIKTAHPENGRIFQGAKRERLSKLANSPIDQDPPVVLGHVLHSSFSSMPISTWTSPLWRAGLPSPVMALSNHPPKPARLSTSYRTFSPSSHSIPQFRDRILTDCFDLTNLKKSPFSFL